MMRARVPSAIRGLLLTVTIASCLSCTLARGLTDTKLPQATTTAPPPTLSSTAVPERQEIVYMHYGPLQDYQALGALHALRSNPSAKVTVILDQDSDLPAWRELANGTALNVYVLPDYSLVKRFKSIYRHSSINNWDKEVFCIYRHLLLHQYMMLENVTSMVYLDLDIVVFNDNLFQLLPRDSAISPLGTFAIHWTQPSLTAFTRYLWHFYERAPRDIARHIAQIGKPVELLPPQLLQALEENELIGEWWPEDVQRHHISDMRLFRDFANTTGALRILCPGKVVDEQCPKSLHLLRNCKQHAQIDAIDFDRREEAVQQFHDAFEWVKHSKHGYISPMLHHPTYGTSTVPGIHFQGHCKKVMPEVLCPNLVSFFAGDVRLLRICTPAVLKALAI